MGEQQNHQRTVEWGIGKMRDRFNQLVQFSLFAGTQVRFSSILLFGCRGCRRLMCQASKVLLGLREKILLCRGALAHSTEREIARIPDEERAFGQRHADRFSTAFGLLHRLTHSPARCPVFISIRTCTRIPACWPSCPPAGHCSCNASGKLMTVPSCRYTPAKRERTSTPVGSLLMR